MLRGLLAQAPENTANMLQFVGIAYAPHGFPGLADFACSSAACTYCEGGPRREKEPREGPHHCNVEEERKKEGEERKVEEGRREEQVQGEEEEEDALNRSCQP